MKSTLSFFAIILICNCIVITSCQNGIPKYSQDRTSNTKQKNQAPIDDQYAYQEEAITMIRDVTPPPPPPPIVEEVIENNKLIFEDQIMPDNQEAEMDEEDIAEEPPINFERHLNTE